MEAQQDSVGKVLEWESGPAKSVVKVDDEGSIKRRLCADYTIYGPLNTPYVVLEVAYSQTLTNAKDKVTTWLAIPSVTAVILVNIQENPTFKAPEYADKSMVQLTTQEWKKETKVSPKFGPIKFEGISWAGVHEVSVSVYRSDKDVMEVEVRCCTAGYNIDNL